MSDLQVPKIERWDVGPDYDHPGFQEMHRAEDGHWVRFEVVTQLQDRIEELERLAKEDSEAFVRERERAEKAEARIAEQEEALKLADQVASHGRGLSIEFADHSLVPLPLLHRLDAALTNTKGSSDAE